MAVATKIITKMAVQLQVGDSFEDNAMQLIPVISGRLKETPTLVEDEAFAGNAFKDVPQKGTVSVAGSINFQIDAQSLPVILEACFGNKTGDSYYLGNHNKKLSVCFYDGVKNTRYANVFIKSLKISGSTNSKLTGDMEVIGVTAEDRAGLETFPENVVPYGEFLNFQEMAGLGYFRIGETTLALAEGNNVDVEDLEIDVVTGFDEQFCNQRYSLEPVFGMTPPEVSGSFKVARYETDKFIDWKNDMTRLQAEFKIQKTPTEYLICRLPMSIIEVDLTDEDIIKQDISLTICRNGIGSSYKNTHMEFNSPINIEVTN